MLNGTFKFRTISNAKKDSDESYLDKIRTVRRRLGLVENGFTLDDRPDRFHYFLEQYYSSSGKGNSFTYRLSPDNTVTNSDAFVTYAENLQHYYIKERTGKGTQGKIDIQQYFHENIQEKVTIGDFTQENKENLFYFGSILSSILYVFEERIGRVARTYEDYSLKYEKDDISIKITVYKGKIASLSYKDCLSSYTAEEGYAYKIFEVKNMRSVSLKSHSILDFLNFAPKSAVKGSVKTDILLKFQTQKGFFKNIQEVKEAHPEKNIDWIDNMKYYVVTRETYPKIIAYLKQFKFLAMDTETTGLEFNFRIVNDGCDSLVGIILSPRKQESFYFPIAHTALSGTQNLPESKDYVPTYKEIKDFLEKDLKELLEKRSIATHNGDFDYRVLYGYGISTNITIDTLETFRLTLQLEGKIKFVNLKYLSAEILGRDSLSLSDLMVNGEFDSNEYTFADLNPELTKYYACPDGDNTFSLVAWLRENKIIEHYDAAELIKIETNFRRVIGYSKFYGMRLDITKATELIKKAEIDKEEYKKAWIEEVKRLGGDINSGKKGLLNPDSPPDRVYAFYEVAKCKPEFRTATGGFSVNKDSIKVWAGMKNPDGSDKYPIAVIYNNLNKTSTMLKSFLGKYKEVCDEEGFFFSNIKDLTTGRISAVEPAYQNFSDDVKKEIRPREGYITVDADYSSIESRIIASLSGQEDLIEAMFDPNMDWHRLQASRMFKVPYALVTKDIRGKVKQFNFGLPYGMTEFGLAYGMYGDTSEASIAKARQGMKDYFRPQPKVEQFFINIRKKALQNMYSETYYKRRRYYSYDNKTKAKIEKEAGNAPIQGMGADVYKRQIGLMFNEIEKNGWLGKVLITGFIHDEVLMEVSKKLDFGKFFETLVKTLEYRNKGFCPFFIGCGFGGSWYQAKSTEIPVDLQYEFLKDSRPLTSLIRSGVSGEDAGYWLDNRIKKFDFEYVAEYALNTEHANKVVDPIILARTSDALGNLAKARDKGTLTSLIGRKLSEKELNALDYLTTDTENPDKDITLTGKIALILKIQEKSIPNYSLLTVEEYNKLNGIENNIQDNKYEIDENQSEEEREQNFVIQRIKEFGYSIFNPFALDLPEFEDMTTEEISEHKKVTVDINQQALIAKNLELLREDGLGYKLYFLDTDKKKLYKTKYKLPNDKLSAFKKLMYETTGNLEKSNITSLT